MLRAKAGSIVIMTAREKALIAEKLTVPVDVAWSAVRGFGQLDSWFPSMATCRVEGEGVGANRFLEIVNGGGYIHDILRSLDVTGRRLVYERVESPFPVSSYFGTVEVLGSFDGLAVVVWTIEFETDLENSGPVKEILEVGIGEGLAGMKAALSTNV